MKWLKTQNIAMAIMSLLGLEKIPIDAEAKKTNFSPEAIEKLKAEFGEDYAVKMQEALDIELSEILSGKNLQLKAIKDELDAIIAEKNLTSEELDKAEEKGDDPAAILAKLKLVTKAAEDKAAELEATVNKLIGTSEGDAPETVITGIHKSNKPGMKIVHSNTHLFSSGKEYDKFEGRPWNARLRDGGMQATNFVKDARIPTLQGDLEHFVRENPD